MILGQLIRTGRHFCECRSSDFIPKSEDGIVAIAYTIHDEVLAHSFDVELFDLMGSISAWLQRSEAIGYILIRRQNHHFQSEFPSPIGRKPMDRVILTAATERDFKVESFYLEEREALGAYKLIPASTTDNLAETTRHNLFRPRQKSGKGYECVDSFELCF